MRHYLTIKEKHCAHIAELLTEFERSQEIFIKDHKWRFPGKLPDAWKMMEVASFGILSKFYKNLHHQLPEKSHISNEMGLTLSSELSSWLEAIIYVRNIIAHHSRLWSKNMVKVPTVELVNPSDPWLARPLLEVQNKKAFLIITCMVYICNHLNKEQSTKEQILRLFSNYPDIPIYKLGFLNSWETQPVWA